MADYDIAAAFEGIENELIESMMRNFKRHRAEETELGYNWSQWQAEQLKALEQYREHNRKRFSKKFAEINGKVAEMIRTARADGNADQEAEILQAIKDGLLNPKKPPTSSAARFFKVNDRKLDALIKATTDDLSKAEHAVLRMSNDKYRKAIFNAQVYANSGSGTYEKAVDMACRDMLRAGLNCIEYKNGARHTLTDYADMAIKTANKRAYLQGEGEKRAEWGISTVIINKRQGGCPECARFIGRVFIDDVWSNGKKSNSKYPLLSSAIAEGLYHPRCKDSHSTYYEGITEVEPVTDEEIEQLEETETLEQQQSYYENQVEKNNRIAEYSLDKDNKQIYSARANAAEEKAEKIQEKIEKTVENPTESGIIKQTKKVDYSNVGSRAFSKEAKTKMLQDERIIAGNDYETAIIYKPDGTKCKSLKGKKSSVDFTKKQISEMKDCVLTHNHPNGTVFSPEDINIMRNGELAEIRACNGRGAYVLRAKSQWSSQIPNLKAIRQSYWDCYEEAGIKYRDIAAQEGKHILMYQRKIQEEGLRIFGNRYDLEFSWEDKL